MHTILLVTGSFLVLAVLLGGARWIASRLLRFIRPGRFRDSLVLPHTERKDWLLAWLPFALFMAFVFVILHFSH